MFERVTRYIASSNTNKGSSIKQHTFPYSAYPLLLIITLPPSNIPNEHRSLITEELITTY